MCTLGLGLPQFARVARVVVNRAYAGARDVDNRQKLAKLAPSSLSWFAVALEGWVFPAPTKSGRLDSLKSQHAKALKDSKVKPFVLYSLRHTMLTRLGEAGADAFAIQKIAGHSSIVFRRGTFTRRQSDWRVLLQALEAYNAVQQQKLEAETKVQ